MRRFVPVTLLSPVLFSTLGVDGGAIFQIVAIENLGLSPTAIGFAFGLGVLSLPVQFLAARMPLSRARHSLQLFLAVSSALVVLLALAVHRGRGAAFASVALAITVMAEIAVSVLFATSWQPLLSHSLVSVDRQRLNTQIRSAGVVIAVVALVIFSALSPTGRVVFLIGVATLAPWAAYGLRPKHTIEPAPPPRDVVTGGAAVKRRIPADLRRILVAFGAIGFASWPLVLVYVRTNLWPTANLGVVGAFQLVGSLAVSFLWRPTAEPVAHRAWVAGGVLVASAVALATFASPLDARATKVWLLVAFGTLSSLAGLAERR